MYVKNKLLTAILLFQIFMVKDGLFALKSLSEIGKDCQTDKFSSHDYLSIYESYFVQLRDKPLKFLEIGFFVGASARMWDQYFPNATLFFIDKEEDFFKKYSQGLSSRCNFYICDQSEEADLLKFIQDVGGRFDVILDDGGHTMNQQITSFKVLFPYVKSGGIYIIEDLHTSYWESFGGLGSVGNPVASEKSTIRFLQSLVDDVNFIGATTGYADRKLCSAHIKNNLNYYQKHIKSIHFYGSLCFILKI